MHVATHHPQIPAAFQAGPLCGLAAWKNPGSWPGREILRQNPDSPGTHLRLSARLGEEEGPNSILTGLDALDTH